MKKLLLILSAIFVSVMGWGQTTMNPYAYDLQSTWNPSTKKLNLSFKLNAQANLNEGGSYGHSAGIMVKLVASDGREYKVVPVKTADIKNGLSYNYEIDFANYKNTYGNLLPEGIPAGTDLTWKVDVAGESSDKGRKVPEITCFRPLWRPCMPHGVAVGRDYNSSNYGKIFVTENANVATLDQYGFTWMKENKANSLIEYEPMRLASGTAENIAVFHRKSNQDGSSVSNFSHPEPHRVRISEDGRIFVTSYHPNSNTSVWEYKGNGRFDRLIEHANKSTDQINTNRIIAMDVKGSGSNLKLLLCEIDPTGNTYNSQNYSKLIIREYAIGTSTNLRTVESGTIKVYYNDYRTDKDLQGMIYQSYTSDPDWQGMRTDGMINIAYGKAENSIWLKMDFGSSKVKPRIVYFDGTNNCGTYYDTGSSTYSGMRGTELKEIYGSSGILVHGIDTLITAYPDKISFYTYNSSGQLTWKSDLSTIKDGERGTGQKVNDFAIDAANNLYAVSSRNYGGYGEAGKYYGFNLMVISLPYSGLTTTKAPDAQKFQIPYPATNLEYHPVEGKNQYTFSFNAVNKPAHVAEIRFYDTKEKMLAGGNDYAFRYQIPAEQYKQGTMSVTFDATIDVSHNKTLEDSDENGYINLPRGEYYWNVYIDYFSTPTPDQECFLPERLSQGMDAYAMADVTTVYGTKTLSNVAIYRPMKSSYYNTFCVPFDVESLAGTCYEGAELLEFTGVYLNNNVNGESILELQFSNSGKIVAGVPYLLKPVADINTVVPLGQEITFHYTDVQDTRHYVVQEFDDNSMTYAALLQKNGISTDDGLLYFILVDNNRLAQVLNNGKMLGLRGFFMLAHELPAGTQVGIAERKPTPTSIIDLNGTQVDVEKFMREGRVYIRVGESLYTLSGERVE